MENILQQIVEKKRKKVENLHLISLEQIVEMASRSAEESPLNSVCKALNNSSTGIIAEFKRRSPSKGVFDSEAKASEIVEQYVEAGAAACSILTESSFFGGRSRDFDNARSVFLNMPMLRKDFIIDEHQIYESKILRADAILLIAAILTKDECLRFAQIAHRMEMEVLLEVHTEEELSYLNPCIDMIGVNNRDLTTFETNVSTSFKMIEKIKELNHKAIPVSESGINDPEIASFLRKAGYKGFLIGETFMITPQPGKALEQFIRGMK